ncbi:aromatic amino acid hydroxylase [Solitalea canadensis]|uniref:Phenylalanine-4-hydroxylase n=1 Tax=Solitalea canadensis (strain ATCC 29591 / DSM 3403 / JCM 21819 / LMG 8368 / NBRC 15130 / NCIMB 12057 / USAM 9D) TaxID=929556 RepID=H8KP07_SOLCM|nr:aromatic amino acid hydroxylase [Solitalea canadensis]AFD05529.1 phenylalanine-4-hydroxylase [Solitalea canadensis DSM 3403]
MNFFNNKQVAALPNHLKQYVVEQHYEHYTPVDHAIWRYVMRQNYSYLKDVAYYPYIPGLKKAGLTIEKIPSLQEMNDALGQIGWGAVTVDGFIPPAAFMEFQAYKVLVIAADIRQIDHIEYTPAPDIIHESAGHAPIIGEPRYADYLSYFGYIGSKAMYSHKDFELYEAIRHLSILKEMPDADPAEIAKAEKDLEFKQQNLGAPSEMALLSRLHWWTVEYGLIGTIDEPKIYGAGLLSSIGESASCMKPDVQKLWYAKDTINYSYDITKPQPQLFVTADFENLIAVLEDFANTMSFRVGGTYGLMKAIECRNTCTAVYSSGLQVTGTFTDVILNEKDEAIYLKTTGPSALSYNDTQLEGHHKEYHADGFSSPIGKLKDTEMSLEDFHINDLKNIGVEIGEPAYLEFESGIVVEGVLKSVIQEDQKLVLLSFTNCKVYDAKSGKVYFEPLWGIYDMAVGSKIVSVFCGAADKDAFEPVAMVSDNKTYQVNYDNKTIRLHELYRIVRKVREKQADVALLPSVWDSLKTEHTNDWLCAMEILEIFDHTGLHPEIAEDIRLFLKNKASSDPKLTKLINDGFSLIANPVIDLVH